MSSKRSKAVKRWLTVSLLVFSVIGAGTVFAQHLTSPQDNKGELKSASQLFSDISNVADYNEDHPQTNDGDFADDGPRIEEV